jgi:GNAT superfamily N-acetyltransferase
METSVTFLHLTDRAELFAAFDLMKQLRPHLDEAEAFVTQVVRQFDQGYRLLAAREDDRVVGLAGYRAQTNLLYGPFFYVDDLVVDGGFRRTGLGSQLLDVVRQLARDAGCAHLVLDTGLHMPLAQRFYFRNGLLARGMHFVEPLNIPTEA